MLALKKLSNVVATLVLMAMALPAGAEYRLNMYRGVTPISQNIYRLHMTAIWVCVAIGIVVFGIMIYSLIFHRKSRGVKPADFHEHTSVEILWAIIPFFILIFLAVPATKTLIAMDDTANADVTIKVTGYQWKWQYEYLDLGINFFSNLSTPYDQIQNKEPKGRWYLLETDKHLVLPIHRKVRFLVTANDVIHSWWVPELGIKRDAIPGFIHEAWAKIDTPGLYRGQCAELCGVNHGFMPIVVEALSEADYDKWATEQMPKKEGAAAAAGATPAAPKEWNMDTAMKLGKARYDVICAACHKPDGVGMPPVFPPLKGSSVAVGKPISRHIERVLKGVTGTAMQSFANQLTDDEIAAVITYERNSWGNNTGDLITPEQVKKLR